MNNLEQVILNILNEFRLQYLIKFEDILIIEIYFVIYKMLIRAVQMFMFFFLIHAYMSNIAKMKPFNMKKLLILIISFIYTNLISKKVDLLASDL